MAKNNSLEWTKFIVPAMHIYLNRKHRTIKMSPLEAEQDLNQSIVRRTYYEKYMKAGLKQKQAQICADLVAKVADICFIGTDRRSCSPPSVKLHQICLRKP